MEAVLGWPPSRAKYEKAIAEYDRLIKNAPDGSFRRREATLAKAESLAGQKKFAAAEAVARPVIKGATPEDVPAQAVAGPVEGSITDGTLINSTGLSPSLRGDVSCNAGVQVDGTVNR